MEIKQLNSSHFNEIVTIKARIIAKSLPKENIISVKLIDIHNNSGESPAIIGGTVDTSIEGAEISDQPQLITGQYMYQESTKKYVIIPYINIQKIVPYELDDDESDDSDIDKQENDEQKNYFTYENLHDIKFKTGDEFVDHLQKNVYAQGFKLSCEHSKDSSFVSIRCYQYISKSPAYENCPFKLNLQAHSYKEPNQYYQLTNTMCLQHSHPVDKFLFCHLILNDKTIAIIKSLSECNIDNIKIAEYIEKVKGIYMTTSQIRYILHQKKQNEIQSETEELDKKMKDENGLSIIKPPDQICGNFYRRAIATFTKDELINLQNYGDLVGIDPTYCCLKSNWSIIPLTLVGYDRQILSGGCIFCSNTTSDIFCWILKLLAYDLPCSPIIKTICSDDDLGLDSAFSKMEQDPSIKCIKRIICI